MRPIAQGSREAGRTVNLVSCLEEGALLDYLAGRLDGAATARAREHVATCAVCHAIASDLVLSAASSVQTPRAVRAASYELTPGATLAAHYALEAPLGEGAMGVVWSARHLATGERVAVKLLKAFDREARRRFAREVTMAALLAHPGLVRVVEVLEDVEAGCPALVLELLEGRSLAAELALGPLDPVRAGAIARDVATALAYVHSTHAVHRDLKPANIFLSRHGTKILDLGLATVTAASTLPSSRITRTGEAVGTPAYMAPEQLGGARGESAADVWSLGVTLYEALAGALPFRAPTPAALLRTITKSGPPSLAPLSPDLRPLLRAMLSVLPSARPSMQDVLDTLTPR